MAALLLIWLLCGWASFCLGALILGACGALRNARAGDRLAVTLWLGYAGLGIILTAISLVQPLRPVHVLAAAALATAAALGKGRLSREIGRLRETGGGGSLVIAVLITATAAALSTQLISSRDSISYHYDIIHLLSRLGSVPGLALVHERFGYLSSWYAIPAAFNHGSLTWRVGTVGNGFTLLLAAGHLQMILRRIFGGRGKAVDFHLALAVAPVLVLTLLLNFPLSPTPDFPSLLLTILVPWTMLLAREDEIAGIPPERSRLVPLLLASAAVTVKIITLPLLPAALIYYCAGVSGRIRSLITGGAIAGAVTLPFLAAQTVLSGCPFYPLPLCLDLPWTAPRGEVDLAVFLKSVRASYFKGLWDLTETRLAAAGVILSLPAILWFLLRKRRRFPDLMPAALTAAAGLLFLLPIAPHARYGAGYVTVLLFAPLLAMEEEIHRLGDRLTFPRAGAAAVSLVSVILLIVPPSAFFRTRSEKRIAAAFAEDRITLETGNRLILPPEIPLIVYDDERDLALPRPEPRKTSLLAGESGRGMFYPLAEKGRVRLRSLEEGPEGGFIKAKKRDRAR